MINFVYTWQSIASFSEGKKDKKAHKISKSFWLQIVLTKLHLDELSVEESKPYGLPFFQNKHWFKNWGKILGKVDFGLHRLEVVKKSNFKKFDKPKAQLDLPILNYSVFIVYHVKINSSRSGLHSDILRVWRFSFASGVTFAQIMNLK